MKKVYIAPVVEAMQCKVEKGFAGSVPNSQPSSDHEGLEGGNNYGGNLFS